MIKSTSVRIQGTFDIAQARATLRTQLTPLRLPPLFTARASTAMTALGELILAAQDSAVSVEITIFDIPAYGVEFSCSLHADKHETWIGQGLDHFQECVDMLEIQESASMLHLNAKLLVEGG